MRRFYRMIAGFLMLSLTFSFCMADVQAAESKLYTYQVTFYTGNHGTFTDINQVNVINTKSGSDYRIERKGSSIVVSNLQPGDRVNFDAALPGAVNLEEDSKYYVKGIRLSGRDNDTVETSSFEVKGDQEYVVAYGIRGDMTSYVVHYQDTSGNTLAESRTYYGNIGDRPMIAFLYLEGYEPQAYNLTKTLSANTAENVFTFTYSRVSSGGGGGGTAAAGGGGAAGGTAAAPAEPEAGPAGTGTPGGGAAAGAGAGVVPGGAAGGDAGAAGAVPDAGVQVPDEEVPQNEGPQELQELDDEEVPLASGAENGVTGARHIAGAVAIAGIGAVALLAILVLLLKKRKKATEE